MAAYLKVDRQQLRQGGGGQDGQQPEAEQEEDLGEQRVEQRAHAGNDEKSGELPDQRAAPVVEIEIVVAKEVDEQPGGRPAKDRKKVGDEVIGIQDVTNGQIRQGRQAAENEKAQKLRRPERPA